MTDTSFPELPAIFDTLLSSDVLPAIHAGVDHKVTLGQVMDFVRNNVHVADLARAGFVASFLRSTTSVDARAAIAAEQAGAVAALRDDLSAIATSGDPADIGATLTGLALLQAASPAAALGAIGGQPVNTGLSAIALLATTAFGRSLLTQANAAAARGAIGAGTGNSNLAIGGSAPANLRSAAAVGSTGNAADAGHVHKAPGATKAFAALAANAAFTGAASMYSPTGLAVVLPVAGTYDLSAYLDMGNPVAGYGAIYVRFVNTTTSAIIADIRLRNDNFPSDQSWFPSVEYYLAVAGQTVALHVAETSIPATRGVVRAGSHLRYRLGAEA